MQFFSEHIKAYLSKSAVILNEQHILHLQFVHAHITAVARGKDLWTQKPSSKSFYLPSPSSKYSLKEALSPNTQLADQKKKL